MNAVLVRSIFCKVVWGLVAFAGFAVAAEPLGFPLGLSRQVTPAALPWPNAHVVATQTENDTAYYPDINERRWSSQDGFELAERRFLVRSLIFSGPAKARRLAALRLESETLGRNYSYPTASVCREVANLQQALAKALQKKYGGSDAKIVAGTQFGAPGCDVQMRNSGDATWTLRQGDMSVTVGAWFETNSGLLSVYADYAQIAWLKRNDRLAIEWRDSLLQSVNATLAKRRLDFPFGTSRDMLPTAMPWRVTDVYSRGSGQDTLIELAREQSDEYVWDLPSTSLSPELVAYASTPQGLKLRSLTLKSRHTNARPPTDCVPTASTLRFLAEVLRKAYGDKSARIDSSAHFGADNCMELMLDGATSFWSLQRDSMRVTVRTLDVPDEPLQGLVAVLVVFERLDLPEPPALPRPPEPDLDAALKAL